MRLNSNRFHPFLLMGHIDLVRVYLNWLEDKLNVRWCVLNIDNEQIILIDNLHKAFGLSSPALTTQNMNIGRNSSQSY